jgi:hypothetical protein
VRQTILRNSKFVFSPDTSTLPTRGILTPAKMHVRRWYFAVLANLVICIALMYAFTRLFR